MTIAHVCIDRKRPSARIPLNIAAYDFDVTIRLADGRFIEGEATLVCDRGEWSAAEILNIVYRQAYGWLHGMPLADFMRTLDSEQQATLAERIVRARTIREEG